MKIYKYFRPERFGILENLKIRFTQPYLFNDPFEMNPYISDFISEVTLNKILDKYFSDFVEIIISNYPILLSTLNPIRRKTAILSDLLQYILYKKFDSSCQISNEQFIETVKNIYLENTENDEIQNLTDKYQILMKDKRFLQENRDQIIKNYKDIIYSFLHTQLENIKQGFYNVSKTKAGILSLSAKNDSLLMWAHYADEHKGFVIEFDGEHKFFNAKRTENDVINFLKKVQYSYKRPQTEIIGRLFESISDYEKFIDDFFMTKSFEWQYEEEYRMIRLLEKADEVKNDIYLFKLLSECIISIFLGSRMKKEDKDKIIGLIQTKKELSHIKIFQGEIDPFEFKINFS